MPNELKEVLYVCSNSKCGATQTIRYWPSEPKLPVTCCVACRAGFGIPIEQMMQQGIGMFPVKKGA